MNMVSRWSVLVRHDVDPTEDLDAGGAVLTEVVARLIDSAITAYLDQCPALARACARHGFELRRESLAPPPGAFPGHPDRLIATASASEFAPRVITISVRLRSSGGTDERVANARCSLRASEPDFEFGDDIRDELIALEHAARHTN